MSSFAFDGRVRPGAVVRVAEFESREESVELNANEDEVEMECTFVFGLW